jgi:hypothetical protein
MTRKDYVQFARLFAGWLATSPPGTVAHGTLSGFAQDFADMLARDNPRFDRARFMAACHTVSGPGEES